MRNLHQSVFQERQNFSYKEHQNGVVVTLGSNFIQDTRVEDITYIFR